MTFECKEGCSECCSPIPFEYTLIKNNFHKRNKNHVINEIIQYDDTRYILFTKSFKCIFLDENNKCLIYNDRPKICKEFGVVIRNQCPYLAINGQIRSEAKNKHYLRDWKRQIQRMKDEQEERNNFNLPEMFWLGQLEQIGIKTQIREV